MPHKSPPPGWARLQQMKLNAQHYPPYGHPPKPQEAAATTSSAEPDFYTPEQYTEIHDRFLDGGSYCGG